MDCRSITGKYLHYYTGSFIFNCIKFCLYIHRDNLKEIFQKDSNVIVEDERTKLINEKAATMTLGILIAVVIYAGIIIVALRSSYPQFLQAGYILFIVALFCFILYFTSRAYYTRKY